MKIISTKLLLIFLAGAVYGNAFAGSVSGNISYNGSAVGIIYVAAFTDSTFRGSPAGTTQLGSLGSYTITGLSDGVYYLLSVISTDSTSNLKSTDPWGVYGTLGRRTPVSVTGGSNVTGINISLVDGTAAVPNPFFRKAATPTITTSLPDVTKDGTNEAMVYNGTSMYLLKQDYSGSSSAKIYTINPYSGEVTETHAISLQSSANGTSWVNSMTVLKGNVWASGGYGDPSQSGWRYGIFKFDIATGASSNQLPLSSGIDSEEVAGLTNDGVNLYAGVDLVNAQPTHGIVKFNPDQVSEIPSSPFFNLGVKPWDLCYADTCLWAGVDVDSVEKVNATNGTVIASYDIPKSAAQVYFDKMFWMYDPSDNTLKAYSIGDVNAVKPAGHTLPSSFSLSQNYPNPFNPTTMINYQLSVNSFVSVEIFDMLGRRIRSLVSEPQNAGTHSVTFNASNLPSGVYFYRLTAGSFVNTKKLMLLK